MSLLAKLAQVDDWEVHGQLISAGVLEVVADASQKHFASAEFQQCACLVLEHLAKVVSSLMLCCDGVIYLNLNFSSWSFCSCIPSV